MQNEANKTNACNQINLLGRTDERPLYVPPFERFQSPFVLRKARLGVAVKQRTRLAGLKPERKIYYCCAIKKEPNGCFMLELLFLSRCAWLGGGTGASAVDAEKEGQSHTCDTHSRVCMLFRDIEGYAFGAKRSRSWLFPVCHPQTRKGRCRLQNNTAVIARSSDGPGRYPRLVPKPHKAQLKSPRSRTT